MNNDGLSEQVERLKYRVKCEEFQTLARRSDTTYLDFLKQELRWLEELQSFRNQYGNYKQK